MKRYLAVITFLLASGAGLCAKEVSVCSPDGSVRISISDSPSLQYSLFVDGKAVIESSEIGIETDLPDSRPKISGVKRERRDETVRTPLYKKAEIRDCCNQAELSFRNYSLVIRAYDDGCAWRFVSKSKKSFLVRNEKWDVNLSSNSPAWINYSNIRSGSFQEQFASSQENTYAHCRIREWNPERIAITPLLIEQDVCLTLAEADVIDYPGLYFCNTDGSQSLKALFPAVPESFELRSTGITKNIIEKVVSVKDYIAECPSGFSFPWRIVGVNRTAASLLESDMVQRLSTPAADCDWSWVKPGKVAWDWWSACKLDGVDFESGINTRTYKYFIDFASEYGLEYIIMDGGWSVRQAADLMQVVPEVDLNEIIEYGSRKGIGVILWAGFAPFRDRMDEVCRHYSQMGVKGFKVDFHNRDDQAMMRYYRQAAQTCAKYHLLIEFHGCSKPTGLERTFPNIINIEAVYGLEMTKFEEKPQADFVGNEVTMPFVRMYAGPVDYTPGAMRNASREDFRYVRNEPMSQGTRCRQIAEYIAFFAPLQMLCDSPTSYQKEPECTSFISRIPVVWEQTIALGGKVGEYLALARRSGNVWYVAAMNGWDAVRKEIPLDFLPEGQFRIEEMRDGEPYSHRFGEVSRESRLTVDLAPGGGYAAIISKQLLMQR